MNKRTYLLFLLSLGLFMPAVSAYADEFWRFDQPDTVDKDNAEDEYELYMRLGNKYAIKAARFTSDRRRARYDRGHRYKQYRSDARKSLANYEKACDVRDDSAEAHYRAAELLNTHWLERGVNTPVMRDRTEAERALDHWRKFEQLTPLDPRVQHTLFNRAIVNTKLATKEAYKQAIRHYTTLLQRADIASEPAGNVAIWLGNLAETYMMTGQLDKAIATYQRTVELSNKPSNAYGLAVALDRDGQGALARAILRDFGERGLQHLANDPTIFFVPRGERHYYLALGHDALDQFDLAIAHYKAFIRSGAHPRYQPRAKDNLAWVEKRYKKHLDAQKVTPANTNRKLPTFRRKLNL